MVSETLSYSQKNQLNEGFLIETAKTSSRNNFAIWL